MKMLKVLSLETTYGVLPWRSIIATINMLTSVIIKNIYIFLVETTYNSSNQDEKQNYTTATNSQAGSKKS